MSVGDKEYQFEQNNPPSELNKQQLVIISWDSLFLPELVWDYGLIYPKEIVKFHFNKLTSNV